MAEDPRVRVVVVDDQVLIREGLRRIFDRVAGYELVADCADGDEVIDAVRGTHPDIVLMDMRMKRVDGAQAMHDLGLLSDAPPVLVLTTYDDDDTISRALDAGAAGFVLKESVAIDLLRAIRVVVGGGAWIDPSVAPSVLVAYRQRGWWHSPRTDLGAVTERETEVLRLIALGSTNAEIADELRICERTVKSHIGHIFTKLGLRDRVAAVIHAYDAGLVDFEAEDCRRLPEPARQPDPPPARQPRARLHPSE